MRPRYLIPGEWPLLAVLAAFIAALPFWMGNDYYLLLFNIMALNAIVVMGLNLLIGSAGQISFGHGAFFGLGAYASAIGCTTFQWPLLIGLLFAMLVVATISLLLAMPTLRLEGHYLVMATLGFNTIVSIVLNQLEELTGGPSGFPGIPRLAVGSCVLDSDREVYYVLWASVLMLLALTLNLNDSRLGRALQAIHEKDLTARVLGIPSYRYKVIVFVLSGLYAGLAGFFYAHYMTFISPKSFDIFYSVQVVTMVVVGGLGSLWGGLAGTMLLTSLPELLHSFEDLHVLLYGLILMGVLVFCPKGFLPTLVASRPLRAALAALAPRLRWKHGMVEPAPAAGTVATRSHSGGPEPACSAEVGTAGSRIAPHPPADSAPNGSAEAARPCGGAQSPILDLDTISLSFGGLQALHEVSMRLLPGEIMALIGPNGAGKTTLLNVISGLIRPDSGEIRLRGKPITRLAPHLVAARGVGRTFQAVQTYERLTVLENVLLGFHVKGRSSFLTAYLHSPGERKEERALRERAHCLLEEFGLAGKAHLPARQLSLLQQKVLELARALALSPSVLLLDEPVGGLNPRESEELEGYISHLRRRGMGVILVEHNMNVVMGLADRVLVLQHGLKIAEGTPKEVQQDPGVIAAYLGKKKC